MNATPNRPTHAVIVAAVVESFVRSGIDLQTVTLDEFKQKLKETIRSMVQHSSQSINRAA